MENKIGKIMKNDRTMEEKSRGKYARVCVIVNLNEPLIPQFKVRGDEIKVEYEGMHLTCFNCGVYGHYSDGCP